MKFMKTDRKIYIWSADPMLERYLKEVIPSEQLLDAPEPRCSVVLALPSVSYDPLSGKAFSSLSGVMESLESVGVVSILLVSSVEVYGRESGDDLAEETHTWPVTERGKLFARAEEEIKEWCSSHDAICTILRPCSMFGTGMAGEYATMFNALMKGYYFLIRDSVAEKSVVTAFDVARCCYHLIDSGVICNVTDGRRHSLRSLAVAMLANAGTMKRPMTLPAKWAGIAAWFIDIIPESWRNFMPGFQPWLTTAELARRTTSLTYSSERIQGLIPFELCDVEKVLTREDEHYPYAQP